MSATNSESRESSPYPREDFFAADGDDRDAETGHVETDGTDAATYLAFRHLLDLTYPICGRTLRKEDREVELSDPELYLPKQTEQCGVIIEYRQHSHRRRYNPETGWINWGESTSTAVPEVDEETYMLAVQNYLADRGILVTTAEEKLERARQLYHDPSCNSHEALAHFIRQVRAGDI